jgi:hypothetical protein
LALLRTSTAYWRWFDRSGQFAIVGASNPEFAAMKVPADLYTRSSQVYRGLEELTLEKWSRRLDSNHRPLRPRPI